MITHFMYYCTKIVMMQFCSIFPNKQDLSELGKLTSKIERELGDFGESGWEKMEQGQKVV